MAEDDKDEENLDLFKWVKECNWNSIEPENDCFQTQSIPDYPINIWKQMGAYSAL